MKQLKDTVSVESAGKNRDSIRLRWRYKQKRYSFCMKSDTLSNRHRASRIASRIEQDIAEGTFDSSLSRYKVDESCAADSSGVKLLERFLYWVRNVRNAELASTTYYLSIYNMIRRWGTFQIESVPLLLKGEKLSASTYNDRLTCLCTFFAWMVRKHYLLENPLEEVKRQKRRKPKAFTVTSRTPLKEEQIFRILNAIKSNTFNPKCSQYTHSHYFPFLFFVFNTGVRNAEAIGLRVQHVELGKNRVHIAEVMARTVAGTHAGARLRKGTKTEEDRYLPLTPSLLSVLSPLLTDKEPDDLVFQSFRGKAIDDRMLQRRVLKPVLDKLKISKRDLYAARHSFGTRAGQQGMSAVHIAYLMGHSTTETASRHYIDVKSVDMPGDLPHLKQTS